MTELEFDSVDLRRADRSMRFYIANGWLDEPPDVRGVDTTVPGRSGRTRRNRVRDVRTVVLNGLLEAQTWEGLLSMELELASVWDPTADPAYLVVTGPYLGLEDGETATLLCVTVNVAPGEVTSPFMRKYSWQLESIDSPPDWVIEGSS